MSDQTEITKKERLLYKESTIGEVKKSDDLKIVIRHCVYEKHPYIDFREYWLSEDNGFVPTKKGFTISLQDSESTNQLFSVIKKLEQYVNEVFDDEANYGSSNGTRTREF